MTSRKATIDPKVLEAIKQAVLEEAQRLGVGVERIILFGSRARGEATSESDYDILVVTREKLGRREKLELATRVATRIAREYLTPVDIIVRSRDEWLEHSKIVGTIEEVAASEGIPV